METPACGQGIGCFFDVSDVAPTSVSQKRVRELVSDHIQREAFGTIGQPGPEDHTSTFATDRTGYSHPDRPAFARNKILKRDAKPMIVQEISLNRFRQTVQYQQHSVSQSFTFGKRLQVGRKDFGDLPKVSHTFEIILRRVVDAKFVSTECSVRGEC